MEIENQPQMIIDRLDGFIGKQTSSFELCII